MKRNGVLYRVLMLFCSNALLQLMGFVYRIALSREAGASALGLNSLIMQVYGLVVSVCISGLNVAVAGLAARLEREQIGSLLKTALIVYCGLWLSAAVPITVFKQRICLLALGDAGLEGALMLMLVCIFMTGVENVLKSIHFGTGNVTRCAASELTEQGVRFALVILLLKNFVRSCDSQTVFFIMLGMTMSELVSVSILTLSYLGLFINGKHKKSGALLFRELSGIAFPATLTAVVSTVFSTAGSLLLPYALVSFGLSRNEALSEIGIMNTAAVPLTMLPMAFIGSVAAVVMPEISRRVSKGESPTGLIIRAFAAAGAFGLCSSALLLAFGTRLSSALFGKTVVGTVFSLLIIKALLIYIQVVSIAVLNGLLMQKTVLCIALFSEAYQLALILLLSPVLGLTGFAVGMAVGELVRLALDLIAVSSKLKNSGFCSNGMIQSSKEKSLRGRYGKKRKTELPLRL